MRRETWIAILLCVDLGLVGALAYAWKNRPVVAASNTGGGSQISTTNLRRLITLHGQEQKAKDDSKIDKSLPWSRLASRDLKQHVANLRAADCPEETVKDIVLGEVNRMFAAREAALKLRLEHLQPWESSATDGAHDFTLNRRERESMNEKRAMLRDILGYDVAVEFPSGSTRETRFDSAFANIPEAKRGAARAIMEDFWTKQDALEERTKGYWEDEDWKEQDKNVRERKEQLTKLLTADEFLDFEIATSGRASSLRSRLGAVDATDQEFREIYRVRRALEDVRRSYSEDPEEQRQVKEERAVVNQRVQEQLKKLLGDERYADYQRSQDDEYVNLAQVAKQNGVNRQSVNQAYEAQKFALQEVQNILRNGDIAPEQRTEMFKSMQGEYDKVMTGILGETAYQRFREAGAYRIYSDEPVNGDRLIRRIINANGQTTIIETRPAAPVQITPPGTIR